MEDKATFCPICESKCETCNIVDNDMNIGQANIIDEKPKWYEIFFDIYKNHIF